MRRLRGWAAMLGGTVRAPSRPLRIRGYTDAYLVTIAFSRRVPGGGNSTEKLIVKVQDRGTREPGRHEQAWSSNEDFAVLHLVRQPYPGLDVDDDRILTFQEVAAGGRPVIPFGDIGDECVVPAFALVMDQILNNLNRRSDDVRRKGRPLGRTTISDYLCGELTVASALPEVSHLAARVGLSDPSSDWFVVDGVVLPNPLRLVAPDSPPKDVYIDYVVGYAHGDLHGGNILVPFDKAPRPDEFQLVDLSAFAEKAPLSRDLVCLLLTTVLRYVAPRGAAGEPGLPSAQAAALIDKLLNPASDRPSLVLPPVLNELVDAAHSAGLSAVQGSGWGEEWETQFRLSLIAQALVCVTFDNLSFAGRRWCFRLAAEAYRKSFCSVAAPAPAGLPVLPRASDQLAPPRTAECSPVPRPVDDRLDKGWLANLTAEPGSQHGDYPRPAVTGVRAGNAGRSAHTGPMDNWIRPAPWAGNQSALQRPALIGDGVPQPRQPLNDGMNWSQAAAKRRTMPRASLRWITAAILGGAALGTAAAVAIPSPTGLDRPEGKITPHPRSAPEAPDRGSSRDEASQRLTGLALQVAMLRETPPPGGYTFICRRVWGLEATDGRGPQKILSQETRLWWNSRRSGRSVTTTEVNGRRTEPPDVETYGEGELSAVLPLPADDLTELRDQLGELFDELTPARRNAAGALRLVAQFHQNHLLTPGQRAVLLSYLAETPGITYRKKQLDQANRPGHGFSADDGESRRDTLIIGEDGRLLSHELTSVGGAVLSHELLVTSTRTETTTDHDCD
ncbi:hypothetical protein HNR22_004914 [Micromonospora jinlongensis]|uniref:Uncharacterized protein n=1 Tax=Micromonospora jinlongensis TaxID=1287877 RepID=A0A7Y9X673_9ACTN|nr:hypothetical protein [Micromonospora jinlongensis]NYH45187.1 hypothetical protein [Micromonospora jinlongensis]